MKKAILIFSIIFVLFALQITATDLESITSAVTVQGEALKKTAPDTLEIVLHLETRSPNIPEAKKEIESRMENLLRFVDDFGLTKGDIRLLSLNMHPSYDEKGEGKNIAYYEMSQDVIVKLKEISRFSAFQSGLLSLGVATISSIDSESSKENEMAKQLLAEALAMAKDKALILANASGLELGKVLKINEDRPASMLLHRWAMRRGALGGGGGNIEAQDVEMATAITVTYELIPKK